MNTGLLIPEIQENEYKFGDGLLKDAPVIQDGQWTSWLPLPENQNFAIEPMACTIFALLNAVEIMICQKYGASDNLCKKFLAYVSGTTKNGNDPNTVAEALRKLGDCMEADYPYTSSDNSWNKFYAVPAKWLYTKALEFIALYNFGHSWVTNPTPERMMDALNYSPLTAGVYAWQLDPVTGYYIRPAGALSEHDVCIYGYVVNEYWKIFDSYAQNCKKLAWNHDFDAVKRYTLNKNTLETPQAQSSWQKFLSFMADVINQLRYGSDLGSVRSPQWEALSRAYRKEQPFCEFGMHKPTLLNPLNTHHLVAYHNDKSLELVKSNWINVCRFHHYAHCHYFNWSDTNPNAREDAKLFTEELTKHRKYE